MFDPCGTRRLEGDDILKRLAEYLNVDPKDLAVALKVIAQSANVKHIHEANCATCGEEKTSDS
jgi:CBS-domain-containing membrane protein